MYNYNTLTTTKTIPDDLQIYKCRLNKELKKVLAITILVE